MVDFIYFNVGGTHYCTSKSTIRKYPNSMLGLMIRSGVPVSQDKNGYYFIDRCGHLFEHILQFIRCDKLLLPDNFQEFDSLECEADFYQIEPLIDAIAEYKLKHITNELTTQNRKILYCTFRGHHLDGTSESYYKIFTKSMYTDYKEVPDITYGRLLNLTSLKKYLSESWMVDDTVQLDINDAPAFFLSQGIHVNPFKADITYAAIDIEIWVQQHELSE